MTVIRAHFDGSKIVPDEPVQLAPNQQVVVLVDSPANGTATELDRATREYYQSDPSSLSEDQDWGGAVAPGSSTAWDD